MGGADGWIEINACQVHVKRGHVLQLGIGKVDGLRMRGHPFHDRGHYPYGNVACNAFPNLPFLFTLCPSGTHLLSLCWQPMAASEQAEGSNPLNLTHSPAIPADGCHLN